jgi:hypothetical protein
MDEDVFGLEAADGVTGFFFLEAPAGAAVGNGPVSEGEGTLVAHAESSAGEELVSEIDFGGRAVDVDERGVLDRDTVIEVEPADGGADAGAGERGEAGPEGDFEKEIEGDGHLQEVGVRRPGCAGSESEFVDSVVEEAGLDFGDKGWGESFGETAGDSETGVELKFDVSGSRGLEVGGFEGAVEAWEEGATEFDPAIFLWHGRECGRFLGQRGD